MNVDDRCHVHNFFDDDSSARGKNDLSRVYIKIVSANENWQEMFSFLYFILMLLSCIPTYMTIVKKKPPAIASHSIELIIKSRIFDSSLNELLQRAYFVFSPTF